MSSFNSKSKSLKWLSWIDKASEVLFLIVSFVVNVNICCSCNVRIFVVESQSIKVKFLLNASIPSSTNSVISVIFSICIDSKISFNALGTIIFVPDP